MNDDAKSSGTSAIDEKDDAVAASHADVKLSESIFMFPNRTIGQHDNVYEGEVRSSVYGVRPCVIKFTQISEQNVREAEILTKLGSHTNVIAIIQSGTYCDVFQDRVYIALDKCHNENLRQYLANRKTAGIEFGLNQAIDFAKQIIVGVMYIHDNNVIHLDLKPSNILISQNLQLIKIADFGLSIVVKSPKSKVFHKHQFGTNGYRPVESFGNGEVSMRTDIFSLGTVLLHILSNGNDVFGVDEHTFIHNIMNDVVNTTGLLVCNPVSTEHLIKCMVSKERCRRPSIWEVSDHPCWTGKEVECNFEYCGDDEVDDNVIDDVEVEVKKEIASTSDIERERNFLAKMREMGFNRKPTILVFDKKSRHLHRFDFVNKSMTRMHGYPDYLQYFTNTAITFDEYIYVFNNRNKSQYRLEYCDVTATWERMSWPDGIEMEWPPLVIASSNAVFLVGWVNNTFVFKYSPPLDRWERLPDRSIDFCESVVYSNGFIYCISQRELERLNLETLKWERMADRIMQDWYDVIAVECGRDIYVINQISIRGGIAQIVIKTQTVIEKYDPNFAKWTELKRVTNVKSSGTSLINAFAIYGDLYIVGNRRVLKYDVKKNELDNLASFPDMEFVGAVVVKMSD